MKLSLVLCCVFLFIGTVQPWSGNYCTRIAKSFRYYHHCRSICSPPCQNTGTCVGPNTCDCTAGHSGDRCQGSGEYEVNNERFTCPQPRDLDPIADKVLECRLDNGTNVFQVDSGDRYVLNYTVTTGGYRELVNTDNGQITATEIYDGVSSHQIMEYRFDYDKPIHCQELHTCSSGDVPLQLEKDITKVC
ncbi:unnamed protein product [Mytilus edulis]|uniref:EGF-like domain-containing protein n=1 Tax=Mytilus edulis TaxID=6550 RepID=A0A8S3QWX3_MYTED|nr:unnamed protein product [Mytilus edulis]